MNALTPRLRFLVLLMARVSVVVIALQIVAPDHHFGAGDVMGLEGSSAHTMHCHGAGADCADVGSGAVVAIQDAFRLPSAVLLPLALAESTLKPNAVSTHTDPEPPRL